MFIFNTFLLSDICITMHDKFKHATVIYGAFGCV